MTKTTEMQDSDKNLIRLIALDDLKAFRMLYDRYWDLLIRHAFARLRNEVEAEDLVQDIFFDIWKNRKVLNIQHSVRNYLFTAVKYKVYRVLDSKYSLCNLDAEAEINSEVANGSQILEFQELYKHIEVIVERLPERQKLVFKLSRFGHLSTTEIAVKLQLAPQTVHNRIHQSLVFLRSELKHFIFEISFAPLFFVFLSY